jgi:succinate dehydrogenase/fumarate reductase flavoprotein subunit
MTEQALKKGAKIVNRVMCFDLITDGEGVIGAVGVNTREDELVIFKAKSVIMATGSVMRLYPASTTPAWMFNTRLSPTCVGDGRAMAYRAGAELASMEIPVFRCGPVYFARAGKGTWAGVLRGPDGKPVGPFVTEPDNKYGDPVVDVYQDVFMEYKRSGRGPVYMDCKGLSDDEMAYMYHWLRNEGNVALLDHLEAEGIDPRDKPVEFRSYHYELFPRGGVYYDETGKTSLQGLYAAGDEIFGGISGAAVFGWIAGENAGHRAKDIELASIDGAKAKIEKLKAKMETILNRKVGATWKEANICLQQIMFDFTGEVRSETLLDAGLFALRRLKQKVHDTLIAENQHDLCRSLEVISLLDVGELIIITARERKETRGKHKRPDYPFTNPQLAKVIVAKKVNGEPVLEWRSLKD